MNNKGSPMMYYKARIQYVLLMSFFTFFYCAAISSAEPADISDYFPHGAGDVWTYQNSYEQNSVFYQPGACQINSDCDDSDTRTTDTCEHNGCEHTTVDQQTLSLTITVSDTGDGISFKTTTNSDFNAMQTVDTWRIERGELLLVQTEMTFSHGGEVMEYDPPIPFAFSNPQQGETRIATSTIRIDGTESSRSPLAVTTEFLGIKHISVPAGQIDNCMAFKITKTSDSHQVSTIWYFAYGVGVIKKEFVYGEIPGNLSRLFHETSGSLEQANVNGQQLP